MPKEIITYPSVQRVLYGSEEHACPTPDCFPCECDTVGSALALPTLTVRWRAGGGRLPDGTDTAHVGVTLTQYETMPWPQWIEQLAQDETNSGDHKTPPLKEEIYSRTLTRAEVNNLIKVLRRARDQAYGRDE
ncbi:MAG TPA: hypothetical protein VN088_19150 [Nocardioides sp.]|nr:hypothetical protein [Nocardioides sp.]